MSDFTSQPLLALLKERSLIDDLQIEEVLQEQSRNGKSIFQILSDFQILDAESILQVLADHLGTEVVKLRDREPEKELLATGAGPLFLQDHGSPTRFRNVWIRRLDRP